MKIIILISLILNALALIGVSLAIREKGGLPWIMRKLNPPAHAGNPRDTRQSVYDALPVGRKDTVFVGDSILAFGEWGELMNDPHCKNRAISGSTIGDTIAQVAAIISNEPRMIIISAGINDLQSGYSPESVAMNRAVLVDAIRAKSPHTKVILLPLYAPNPTKYKAWIAPDHPGVHMPTLEECRTVSPESEMITDANTYDGLHLNGAGLKLLAKKLAE